MSTERREISIMLALLKGNADIATTGDVFVLLCNGETWC